MADIPGTNVASMITPFTTQDIIATHSETYGQGGYRSEKTVADMNAIIASRRKEGMIVHVLDEDKDYILKDGKFVVKTSEVIVDSALSTTSLNPVQNKVITNALNSKQNSLVSGTSIKTINSVSLLGSGNINIPVITVDSATSSTSTNPLQNRVITASITDINTKLTPISTAWNKKNTANGLLVLDTAGLVPSSNLPSYVDDVLDVYATYDQSATGTISNVKLYTDSSKTIAVVPETGKIYIDVSSGKPPYQFRWSGTAYVTLNTGGLIIGTISGTAFDGGKGQELYSEYAGSRKTIYQRAYSFFNAITPASDKFMQNISASYTATAVSLTKAYKNFAGTSSSESLTINAATTSNAGVMSAADKTKLDSYQASTGATPNSIAKRDENGDLTMRYPITNAGVDNSSSIDYVVYISNSATKYMRHCSLSHFTDVMRLVTTTSRGLMSPADKKKLEDIDTEKFLRKDIDDIANGNITFNNGIYVKGSYANLQSIFEQGGNSILEQGGNGIIETAETQAAPTDITLADLANVDGTVNEPAYKRMILTKLAGATTWTQEYIDPLIEITEAPSNDLYYARRNKAWVNFTPFSGNYSDLSGKPTIPTKLANPYALTFSGAVTATYDGSGAVNVNIPVGGGGGGGSVIVDSSLSTTSVNPVQNRVITNAINNANSSIQTNADNIEAIMSIIANIPSIRIDTALSTTSTNAVQNKVITTALNGKQANLVSGTNIKTVGGQSLLGSGNIAFPTITVDSALSSTSTNPLQNKVINSQFESVATGMQLIMSLYDEIKTSALTSSSVVTSITTENRDSTSLVTSVKSVVSYISDNLIDPITPILTAYLTQNTKNGMLILDSNGKVPSNLLPGTLLTLGTTSTTAFRGDYGNILFTNFGSGTNLTGTQRARNFFGKIDVSNLHFLSGDYTWTQTNSEIEIEFEQYNFTGTKSASSPLINFPIATTAKAGLLGGDQCSYLVSLNTEYNNIANKANYIKARKFFNSINTVNECYYCGAFVSPSKNDIEIKITKRNFDTSSETYDYINLPAVTLNSAGVLTSTQFTNLSNKQEKLVSGTSIKTINGQSLLGSGNIAFPAITVDSALSSTSTNPLQNKVINSQFESVATGMQLIMSLYDEIKTSALTSSSVVTSITTENRDSTSLVTSVKSVVSYISDNLIDPITPILTAYLTQNTKNGMLILDSNGKVPSNLLPGTLLTLGTTSTTAFRGDYGNILFTNFGSGTNLTGTQRARNFFGKIDVSNLHFLSGDYTWTQTNSEIEIEFEQYNFTGTKSASSPLINFPIATTAKAGLLGGDQCSYLVSLNTEYNNIANKANYIKARKFFNSINTVNECYYCGAFVSPSKNDIEIKITKRNFDTSSETYDYINLPAVTLNSAGVLTSTQFTNLSNKQEKLVSGTSIKTINGQSLLGSGNINISGAGLNSYTTTLDIFNISNDRTITSTEFAEVGRIVTAVKEGKQILYNYKVAEFGTGVLNCHLADDLTCLSWVVTSYTDTEIFYIDPTLSTDKWARISLVKSDFSNITSKSFGSSSSYYKLPDGLLIQWGTIAGRTGVMTVFMPATFKTTYYTIQLTGGAVNRTERVVYSPMFYTRSESSFSLLTRYMVQGGDVNETAWNFTWLAIGNWK